MNGKETSRRKRKSVFVSLFSRMGPSCGRRKTDFCNVEQRKKRQIEGGEKYKTKY